MTTPTRHADAAYTDGLRDLANMDHVSAELAGVLRDCAGVIDSQATALAARSPSPDGLQEPALREALEKAADAYEAFVTARNAMNAARPAIDATPAERALYDERYKADHAAEREHFSTAIQLAHFARSILATLPQQAATDEGEAQAEIGRLRTELDRFYNPADRNLSTSDPIVPLPGFDPRHLKGLALLFREWCGERMWGRPQEAELAARQVETAYLILSTPTSHPPAAETRMRRVLAAIRDEGMQNHNTRCRKWWPDVLAALTQPEPTAQQGGGGQ